jgi:serine phosphatase RsbU (regulator of sigma subunit)/pSer/pThr/pTyr-binding forkhead associated (FHA) protein
MAVLVKVTGDPAGQLIELKDEEITIGRLPECAIVLDPHGVSRKHACIRRQGTDFFIADLNSRNKTKVNERELPPDPYAHQLRQGDRINICDVEFIFYKKLPEPKQEWGDGEMVVTDGVEDSTIHTLDASRSDLVACSVHPEAKLKAILEITQNLCSNLQIDTVAPKILDTLLDLFPQAERGFLVLMKDGDTKRGIRKTFHKIRPLRRTAVKGLLAKPSPEESRLSISRSIINHVLGQKKAVLSQDAGNDTNLPTSASIADLKIRSVMCAPLLTPDGQGLGILQLDTSDRKQFGQDDLDLLVAVARQAAIAIENASMHESLLARERIERDLRLAEQVQRGFLPQSVPKLPGYEFFAYYNAAYEVGGDYYDFVPLPGNRLAIALGDVSGKGVAAALMMAKFSGDTRYCILTEDAPAAAAEGLNDLLCSAGIEEKFITLSLGVLDLTGGELTLCSAGHLPVIIRRGGGQIEEVGGDIAGFPLGILPAQRYKQAKVSLEPGEVVVVYSDGVTDARNPREELFDSKDNHRLARRVAESPGGAEAVGRAILQEIREFSAGHVQADDITLICFGRT